MKTRLDESTSKETIKGTAYALQRWRIIDNFVNLFTLRMPSSREKSEMRLHVAQ